jgi:hypothetical protein
MENLNILMDMLLIFLIGSFTLVVLCVFFVIDSYLTQKAQYRSRLETHFQKLNQNKTNKIFRG